MAAELLMFDDPGCVWCRRWTAEIGQGYPRSPEGVQAPLRRIPIRNQANAGVALARPVNATPTFVVVEDGQEVGRLEGYAGRDFFYPMLDELLRQIPAPAPLPGPVLRSTICRCQPADPDTLTRSELVKGCGRGLEWLRGSHRVTRGPFRDADGDGRADRRGHGACRVRQQRPHNQHHVKCATGRSLHSRHQGARRGGGVHIRVRGGLRLCARCDQSPGRILGL